MTYYKAGAWNAICDRCGFEHKSDELKKEWTGLMVCSACWEARHPSDLFNPDIQESSIPWARPGPTDVFVGPDWTGLMTEDGALITSEALVVLLPET